MSEEVKEVIIMGIMLMTIFAIFAGAAAIAMSI